MRSLTRLAAVALCAVLAVSIAGCGHHRKTAKSQDISADPSVVGTVTVYTSTPTSQANRYLSDFRKQYPNVKLTVVSDTATATVARLIKEKKAPVADVVWHTPLSAVYGADEATALAAYAYHPGQYDAVQADYSDPDHPDNPLVTGTDAQIIGWVVDTSKTGGSTPAAFADLTDSKYQGQIVMPAITTDAGYTMVSLLLSSDGEDTTWPYLDQLDKNVAYYTTDQDAPAQAVADGNAAIGIGFDKAVTDAGNSGGSTQIVWPALPEMSPYDIDVDALVAKPAPKSAAKVFLDWAISDSAMNQYAVDTPITSVDEGNGLPQGYPPSISDQLIQNADWGYMADNRAAIVAKWMKRYGKKVRAQ